MDANALLASFAPIVDVAPQKPSLVDALIELAAALKRLSTQAHLIHLNVEGPNFLSIHAFFKDQYLAHLEHFDKIAEHVRAMDVLMPLATTELQCSCIPFNEPVSYAQDHLLMAYITNLDAFCCHLAGLSDLAEEEGAIDVVDTLGGLCGDLKKAGWFAKSVLR